MVNNMGFITKVIVFDSVVLFISILLIFYLHRSIIRNDKKYISELVESNIERGYEISKLNKVASLTSLFLHLQIDQTLI